MRLHLSWVVAGIVLSATSARGQVNFYNSSTAGEGYSRGIGNIISSQGQKNLSDSQAAINLTDARSNQIDNQVKSVNAYWEKKGVYDQHLQAYNEQIEQKRAEYLARHGLTSLTPQEFDQTTGAITWPKVLEQAQYDQYRKKLDELFHQRSYVGALSGDEYMEATTAMNDWHTMLVKQSNEYPAPILDQMLRFILKVKRELDENLS
jgi:hypothetical protein